MDFSRYITTTHSFLNHLAQAQLIARNPHGDWERGLILLTQVANHSVTWTDKGYDAAGKLPPGQRERVRLAWAQLEEENLAEVKALRAVFHLRHARILMARLKTAPTYENIQKARNKLLFLRLTPDAFSDDETEIHAFEQIINYSIYGATEALVAGLRHTQGQTPQQREDYKWRISSYLRQMNIKPGDFGVHPKLTRQELKPSSPSEPAPSP
jgi:hypothetical protein